MALRYQPISLRHAGTPKLQHFALLAGMEAAVRGTLISTIPIAVYDAFGSAQNLSTVYFTAGVVTLFWGLLVPRLTQIWPRRFVYSGGCLLYLVAMALFMLGTPVTVPLAILTMSMSTVTCFVCFNAYVLDYVPRPDLGRTQSLQMVYAAAPWALGPLSGVWLRHYWAPLPFIVAGFFALALLVTFWFLRLGNGKQIARAKGPAVNPLAYLGRFFQQPRLIAGWLFAVIRSCGWWVYVVYVPIFCIESGLGDKLGGTILSISNATLLLSPFMASWARRRSVRVALRLALGYCALLFCLATATAGAPVVTVACLFLGSFGLVMLDVAGGLPFMMAVKPSERSEMAAVYSSFRDVSGIATPGMAWLVLWVAPLNFIFAASGLAFAGAFAIAGRLHPRLGALRPSRGGI
ncbi:MFS transporter [Cypionkella sp.]|jgi:MFS transporter, ACDE family, multidrug resistance protein|uniref:MFS transporter n=1 Tax=Cypionkella sp. TaxID=2811411 RepID=UPI003750588A